MTVDERFDRLDESVSRLSRYVTEMREESTHRFDVIDQRLDILSATVASLDSRFPPLTKAILDFGTLAGRLTREQSRVVGDDLAARVF